MKGALSVLGVAGIIALGVFQSITPTQPVSPVVGSSGCDPNYAGACVPIVSYDLNCSDIATKVQVVGDDPNGFDRDGDGFGCESYG